MGGYNRVERVLQVMIENITKQINSFLSALKTAYSQQGQIGKILLPGLVLLVFCCLCSVLVSVFRPRNASTIPPSPIVLPGVGVVATPTALFSFASLTPFSVPTLPSSTPLPTLTPPPTGTETPTSVQLLPTVTASSIPTDTAIPTVIPATATSSGSVLIVAVNKPREYVDIQNISTTPVDLSGWKLVSETGNQSCDLRGTLQPNEVLRIWARRGNPGFDCGFSIYIWKDNQADPAVLYNAQGEEVSRYP
jgi:Lamin Tail Domain